MGLWEKTALGGLSSRVALVILVVASIGLAALGLYVEWAVEQQSDRLREQLVSEARLLQDELVPLVGAADASDTLRARVRDHAARFGSRVSVVARDGTVISESDREGDGVAALENQAARPEVQAALAGRVGVDVRRGRSGGRELLFIALPLEAAGVARGVLRLGLPVPEVTRATAVALRTTAAGAVLAVVLAAVVAVVVSRRVTRRLRTAHEAIERIAAGDLTRRIRIPGTDEIAVLGDALDRLTATLQQKLETLDAEQAKGRAILDGMVEGVVAVDARGRLLFMNPAARAILGVDPEPVEGRPLIEVIRQKELYDFVEGARVQGAANRGELELPPPVGRTLAVRAAPLGLAGATIGVLLVFHDMTELRRLERARTEFVANVSHELRTPLTCIKGYLETLLDGAVDDPAHARSFLETANTHAERLGRLVDDLLQLSNIESGRAALVPVVVDLPTTVDDVAEMFEPRAVENGLCMVNRVPEECRVRADRDRLTQILVNLLDNAVKFTEKGGEIAITAVQPRLGVVEVWVRDTGVGIPSTDLPRITERFYRVDRARSRELGGTGLGLAIVKHLVHAHGGELWIDSILGQGTTVRFTLPAG